MFTFPFPLGTILLTILLALAYFGGLRRVLDKMKMHDRTALGLIMAIIAGSFVEIPVSSRLRINLGAAVIIGTAVYLWVSSGTAKEKLRSLAAGILTGVILYAYGNYFDAAPEAIWIDPLYLYPLIAGVMGYLFGRSRRGAFCAAVTGILLLDFGQYLYLRYYGIEQSVVLGGAGIFDSLVAGAVLAVLLADFIGEAREALQGGASSEGKAPELLAELSGAKIKPIPAEQYQQEAAKEEAVWSEQEEKQHD